MRRNFLNLILVLLYLLAVTPLSKAQHQQVFYVYDGKNLQGMDEGSAQGNYVRWQIWLYPERVRIPHRTAGLPYSRWGLIEASSTTEGPAMETKALAGD